jgi:hypothetical protein
MEFFCIDLISYIYFVLFKYEVESETLINRVQESKNIIG